MSEKKNVMRGLEKAGAVGASATLLGGAGSALLLALAASPAGAAATWTVDTLADGTATASDCTTPVVGSCSLRDALAAAAVGDAITFSPTLFTGGAGTVTLTEGELVNAGVDVIGPGADLLTVDAAANGRVFNVVPAPSGTTISGVTLTNGLLTGGDGGGAIRSETGTLTVRESVITGNVGAFAGGAIIASSLVLVDSTVSDNSSEYFGGGIAVIEQLFVTGSTIADNSAVVFGGGVAVFGENASATVIDSTVSGNTAASGAGLGGYSETGSVTIANSTFFDNSAIYGGGAITLDFPLAEILMSTITGNSSDGTDQFYSGGGLKVGFDGSAALTLTGTVIAGNTSGVGGTPDLIVGASVADAVTVTANDSFIGSGVTPNVTFAGSGLLRGDVPMLGALADNGGPTLTMLPLVGSPLIDAGPTTVPAFPGNDFDQRGPGFARVLGPRSDIGAVEVPPPAAPVFTG